MSTASTTIVSDLKNATPATSNTLKLANAAGLDMGGMLALARSKALELKACLALIERAVDGADPNLTTVSNILASLA